MKKVLILIALLFIPSIVKASTLERDVTIQFKSNNNVIETKVKFKIKDDNNYINDIVYETDNNGLFKGKIQLDEKTYYVEVVDIPNNILSYTTSFNVNGNNVSHNIDFSEQKGLISINRKGIFLVNNTKLYIDDIKGAKYEIYAKENINSYTGKKFIKNQLIDTITSNHGFASIELPMGKYYVKEKSINNYFKDDQTYEVIIDFDHIYNNIDIATLHKPLEINSDANYELCLDDDIVIDDKIVAYKDTCYGKASKYYLPYGRYVFMTGDNEYVIEFSENNSYFEYIDNSVNSDLLLDTSDDEYNKIKTEKVEEDTQKRNEENNKEDIIIPGKYNGSSSPMSDDTDNPEEPVPEVSKSEPIEVPKPEVSKSETPESKQVVKHQVKKVSDSKMPITSGRTNNYSLLLSGLSLIILGILKKG